LEDNVDSERELIKQRLQKFHDAMSNPCNEDEHDYQYSVGSMGKATMMHQICSKCFDFRGLIDNWQEE
jgi:hypothetical protein